MSEAKHKALPGLADSPGSAWLPIATAPRDGTRILVVMYKQVQMAFWDVQQFNKNPRPFFRLDRSFGERIDRENQPDLWRPLPELPNVQAQPLPPTKESA